MAANRLERFRRARTPRPGGPRSVHGASAGFAGCASSHQNGDRAGGQTLMTNGGRVPARNGERKRRRKLLRGGTPTNDRSPARTGSVSSHHDLGIFPPASCRSGSDRVPPMAPSYDSQVLYRQAEATATTRDSSRERHVSAREPNEVLQEPCGVTQALGRPFAQCASLLYAEAYGVRGPARTNVTVDGRLRLERRASTRGAKTRARGECTNSR